MNYITIIGLIAGIFTTISSIPQAIKTIKTRSTEDLSLGMYLILTLGLFLWLIYGILKRDMPIILANLFSLIFILPIVYFIIRDINKSKK